MGISPAFLGIPITLPRIGRLGRDNSIRDGFLWVEPQGVSWVHPLFELWFACLFVFSVDSLSILFNRRSFQKPVVSLGFLRFPRKKVFLERI